MFLVEVFGMPCIWPEPDAEDLRQLVQVTIPNVFARRYRGDAILYVNIHQSDARAMTALKFPGVAVPGVGDCVLVTVRPMGTKTMDASVRAALIEELVNAVGGYVFTRTSKSFGSITRVDAYLDAVSRVTSSCLRQGPQALESTVAVAKPQAAA